ncbi:MAG: tyrosine-type recombinase/integrase [Actinomycetota bacterium]|nr:tyrosine-type recombinase/integrase [Actinomycetota bacterium]
MLYCGLRSAEVLDLDVADVDIGGRWLRVVGKGERERRVPLDAAVASVIQVICCRVARIRQWPPVPGGQRTEPRTAVDRGRSAHDLSLSPRAHWDYRWASPRAAAHVCYLYWLRAGEARGLRGRPATCLTVIRNLSVPMVTSAT